MRRLPLFVLSCLILGSTPVVAQPTTGPETEWLLATLKDSFTVNNGDVLSIRHTRGDVRIEATDTDRVQVTALAQHHADDPRTPTIRIHPTTTSTPAGQHAMTVDFAALEIAEQDGWAKRRIDIGLLVPRGLRLEVETTNGVIEAKRLETDAKLISERGDVSYKGTGNLEARSERGTVKALIRRTQPGHSLKLSSLTGGITCTFLADANATVEVETRGPITTDYSIEIDRTPESPLKNGRVHIGADKGSTVALESHSGAVRLQGLIAPESADDHP